jgi:hypothetical protein
LILSKFNQIWHPEAYHGRGRKTPFFQGWFFKLVDKEKKHVYAIIPGIYITTEKDKSHSFIQVLENQNHQSYYFSFPLQEFSAALDKLEIRIGNNYFSKEKINVNLQSEELDIKGKIAFGNFKPWPIKLISPGVMGWYAFVPFMECYHGVLSLDHSLQGSLTANNKHISFDQGKGYIENDWGRSFPEAYIWMQSNHFTTNDISLTASIAKIPWLRNSFRGFIIGLLWEEKLYRFTTYTGATLRQVSFNKNKIFFTVADTGYELRVKAVTDNQGQLHAPYDNQMVKRVSESLDSEISIEFYKMDGNNLSLIFKDQGSPASAEANGNLDLILD